MPKSILCLSISIIICLSLFSCNLQSNTLDSDVAVISTETDNTENIKATSISIDDIIFLGESTTYHMKSRGVLSGGKETTQVWAPKSGTLMLDPSTSECRIIYPETKEEISLEEAIKAKKPKVLLFTFGLNGATSFIKRGEGYFKLCYQKLLDTVKKSSPTTEIIINSCFPIAKNMDMSRYTVDAKALNHYIDNINAWACRLAKENQVRYIDTASVIKDNDGFLASDLQAEDGYHLNEKAYKLILKYLNTELQK